MDIKKVSAAQTTNKIAFKARFFKDDIKTLIKEATPKSAFDSKDPRVEIPKLYTALKFLDENPLPNSLVNFLDNLSKMASP